MPLGRASCARGRQGDKLKRLCWDALVSHLFPWGTQPLLLTAASRRITGDVFIALPVSKGCADFTADVPCSETRAEVAALTLLLGHPDLTQTRAQGGEFPAMRQQIKTISWLGLLLPRQGMDLGAHLLWSSSRCKEMDFRLEEQSSLGTVLLLLVFSP